MKDITYISFDKSSRNLVLEVLGKGIDTEGFIVETSTRKRVVGQDGQPVHIDDFGGVRKGSQIFFKKDLASVLYAIQQTSGSVHA